MDIPKELLDRLDILSAKIGVASEHVWEFTVTQQRMEGFLWLFFVLIPIIFIIVSLIIKNYKDGVIYFHSYCGVRQPTPEMESKGIQTSWASALLVIGGILFVIWMLSCFEFGLKIFNPEFYALKELLRMI